MSPAHAKTSDDAILRAAIRLVEEGGLDALTMQAVATAVGVRAPSLYKRIHDRAALVRAIQESAASELAADLCRVSLGVDARADIVAMADAFRGFAHHRAGTYGLLFAALPDELRISPASNGAAIEPLFRALASLTGDPAGTLEAARLLVAFVHGFVSMELAGAFRLGGDVDAAWRFGVATIVDAVARPRSA
jgi:AcrR family transcriptional regulator